MPKIKTDPKTCKTCIFWDFKVSGASDRCWGRCISPSVRNATYVSFKIPLNMKWSKEIIYEVKNYMANYVEIYFEETHFGCMYHAKRLQ